MRRICCLLVIVFLSIFSVSAQNELPSNIDPEIKAKLIQRGFDPDNIDPANLDEFQDAIEEVQSEIEDQKEVNAANDTDNFVDDSIENVVEEVQESTEQVLSEVEEKIAKLETEPSSTDDESSTNKIDGESPTNKIEEVKSEVQDGTSLDEALSDKLSEELIENAEDISIYGHNIFHDSKLKFFRTTDSNVTPANYMLSSGDDIMISIFGRSQVDLNYTIDQNGFITARRVGKVYLRGMNFHDAEDLLRKRFARTYSFLPEQFNLTLKSARTITIGIYGEVLQPGTYSISALNSALNSILAAGGPTALGTVRNIRLTKGSTGKVVNIDVYEFLKNPNSIENISLDNNDVIHVPLSKTVVSVGGVRRAMKYELKDGETLSDLIEYAGGPSAKAYVNNIKVERIVPTGVKILDTSLSNASVFKLQHRDRVNLRISQKVIKETVEIFGDVDFEGDYGYKKGMNLASLLDKAKFSSFARKDFVFVYRRSEDGMLSLIKVDFKKQSPNTFILQPFDRINVLSLQSYQDTPLSISIEGAVRISPSSIDVRSDEKLKVSDLVDLAGGLKNNAYQYAMITRFDRTNNQWIEYKKIDILNAVNDTNSIDNILLKEGDRVLIMSNERFNKNTFNVTLTGDVKEQVSVPYDKSIKFKDLLMLAGGLNESANDIAVVRRSKTDNSIDTEYVEISISEVLKGNSEFKLHPKDVITVYNKYEFKEQFNVRLLGEVNRPGTYNYDSNLTINTLFYMSGGLTRKAAYNKVNIYRVQFRENKSNLILHKQLEIVKKEDGSLVPSENITLAPYDVVIIRPIPDYKLQEVVYVRGEVQYPGPYVIQGESRLSSLVRDAGGLTKQAFPLGATLIRNRGSKKGPILINLKDALRKGKKHEDVVLIPGDELFIPRNEDIVSIRINGTRATREYTDTLLINNQVQFSYQGKKSAKWYIDRFVGGFSEDFDKESVRVIEPTGRIRATRKIGWFYDYPTVIKGSTIAVDSKPEEEKEDKKDKFNLSESLKEILAITSSAVTIIALARTINNKN